MFLTSCTLTSQYTTQICHNKPSCSKYCSGKINVLFTVHTMNSTAPCRARQSLSSTASVGNYGNQFFHDLELNCQFSKHTSSIIIKPNMPKQQAKKVHFLLFDFTSTTPIKVRIGTLISFCCWSFSKCSLRGKRSCLPPVNKCSIKF